MHSKHAARCLTRQLTKFSDTTSVSLVNKTNKNRVQEAYIKKLDSICCKLSLTVQFTGMKQKYCSNRLIMCNSLDNNLQMPQDSVLKLQTELNFI